MTLTIILIACVVLLIAFLFDVFALRKNVPSVILLLSLGILIQLIVKNSGVVIPDMNPMLPVLGTTGLILIVFEGALELKLSHSRNKNILNAFYMALFPMLILAIGLSAWFHFQTGSNFKTCLANAIPLAVISSAVAIPSVKNLPVKKREFVVYESSMSDILGVLFFNFVALNQAVNINSIEHFLVQIQLIIVVTIIGTAGIAWMIKSIDHPVKHTPVILVLIMIYAMAKTQHLPGLVFVLICGLFLGNITRFARLKWIKKLEPEKVSRNMESLKELVVEATFLIRVLFFVLFGFLINVEDIINPATLPWAGGIVLAIFLIRALFLRILKAPVLPVLFVAPRGLITILLFYSLVPEEKLQVVNISLIIQVVLITAIIMMLGLLLTGKQQERTEINPGVPEPIVRAPEA